MGKPGTLTPEDIEMIKKLTEGGYSQGAIGDRIGCTSSTVAYHQKKLGLKASNKWHFGETAKKEPLQLIESEAKPTKQETEPAKYVAVERKNVQLIGIGTGFTYCIGTKSDSVRIRTGYNEREEEAPIVIDLKDLVNFGNEILDIAESIQKMKTNMFSL